MRDKEKNDMIIAALCYFCAWNRQDSGYCKFFDPFSSSWCQEWADSIAPAMSDYAIARGFRNEYENGKRYKPLFCIVNKIKKVDCAVDAVNYCASELEKKYKRKQLSAASKLLWFKFKSPIIIYDNLALKGLNKRLAHRGVKVREQNYAEYYKEWRTEYGKVEGAILKICKQHLDKIDSVASEGWFRERVFDRYLWEKGKAE